MADVTGEIGGQQVQLNNAATEATLKQLLQATIAMAQKQGADLSATTKLQKELAKLQKETEKNFKIQGQVNKKKQEEAKQLEAAAAARKKEDEIREKSAAISKFARDKTQELGETMLAAGQKLTAMANSVANMGSSLSSAAGTFSHIPIVGGMLSGALGAVAGAAEKLQGSFRTASSVGATFGGSIRAMTETASVAGLTFDQFSNVIKNNSEDLVRLGGSTSEGAKRLAGLSKTLKETRLQDDLARLGYTSEDIANGMAKSVGTLYRGIGVNAGNQAEAAKVGAEYLKNLTAISAVTGKNREELEKETQRRANDAKIQAAYAMIDAKSRGNLEALFNSVPDEMRKAVEEIAVTGTAQSDEAKAFMYTHGALAQEALQLHARIKRKEEISRDDVIKYDKAQMKEMGARYAELEQGTGQLSVQMGYVGGAAAQMGLGIVKLKDRSMDLETAFAEQDKAAKEGRKNIKDALDPAAMVRAQQDVAKASNEMTQALASQLPQLVTAIQGLTMVLDPLTKAFGFFMDHLYLIAGVAGSLVVAMKALNFARESMMKFRELTSAGKQPGHPGAIPLNVKEVSGGGLGKGGAEAETAGEKKGGKFGRLGGVLKGGLGAIGGVALGYGADALKEAGHEKTGAAADVGAEALTYGGTGAMIGSVIPGLGTAIGGAIGAALGTGIGLYKNWGSLFGSNKQAAPGAPVTATPAAAAPAATQASVRQVDNAIAATAAPTPPPGSGVNYNASPEQMLKQFAKSQGVTGTAKPIPTTTGQVQTVTDQMKADAEKKAAAEAKVKEDAAKKALEEGKPPTGTPTPPAQENPATMLATLNTTMTQLLKTNRELLSISEKQLSVQRQFTGDVFTV